MISNAFRPALRRLPIFMLAGAGLALLSGCTSFQLGMAPPGTSSLQFRKCLVTRGFIPKNGNQLKAFDPAAAAVLGSKDWDTGNIAEMPVGSYIAFTAIRLRSGLVAQRKLPATADAPVEIGAEWPINRYLDCYVDIVGPAPVPPTPTIAAEIRDRDVEGRVLRGHMLLAALSRYGAAVIASHPGGVKPQRAAKLFQDIRQAELALRSASPVMNTTALGFQTNAGKIAADPQLTGRLVWEPGTERVFRILQVAVDLQAIETDQALDRIGNVVGLLNGSGALKAKSILKDAVGGLLLAQKAEAIGAAYGNDGVNYLAAHRTATTYDGTGFTYDEAKGKANWKAWDAPLDKGCRALAVYAQLEATTCLPSSEELTKAVTP